MKRTLLIATLLLIPAFPYAQDKPALQQPKSLEEIAQQTPISVFIPDAKTAEKLTPEEQQALKLHMSKFLSAAMAQSYKQGAEDSSAFLLKEFDKFAAQQSKPSRGERIAAGLQGFGQGMAGFRQSMVLENARRINCISNTIGNFTYTNCY